MEKSLADLSFGGLVDHFPLTKSELRSYSPLSLAYIGDCIYELMIRTMIVTRGNERPASYHGTTISYVNAAAQTRVLAGIKPVLTEEENAVFRRGRNAKSLSPAKNQSLHDYRIATGFEALMGYLYLSGQSGRIQELLETGIPYLEEQEEH